MFNYLRFIATKTKILVLSKF